MNGCKFASILWRFASSQRRLVSALAGAEGIIDYPSQQGEIFGRHSTLPHNKNADAAAAAAAAATATAASTDTASASAPFATSPVLPGEWETSALRSFY